MIRTFAQLSKLLTGALLCATLLTGTWADRAEAQSLFETVITVNDAPITRFELEQRALLLRLLRAPGDPNALAREQLIDDRLRLQAARADGFVLTEEQITAAGDRFASQVNMTGEELMTALEGQGLARESFQAFLEAGATWAELTRAKFGPRVSVTEDDIERAQAALGTGSGVEVLLSEIIIPYTPQTQQSVEARAVSISQLDDETAFAVQARRYSATRTAGRGGRLPWTPLNQLPPGLQGIVLGLAPGEVTDPLPLEGAVALFYMRDIRETDVVEPDYAAIEYAAYYIDGGRSEAALNRARQVEANTDTCDDLYGIAQGQPASVLERGSKAPNEIPQDIALELSKLDAGEVSYALTRANGQTLVLLMLCGRSTVIEEPEVSADADADAKAEETTADSEAGEASALSISQTEQLSRQIGDQRLASFSDGYLAQLRSEARIVEK